MKSKTINDCLYRFHIAEENGGEGIYSASLKKHYILAHDEWKEDSVPEILDGHNVYDLVDPDILERVEDRPCVPRKHNKDKKFTSQRMGRQLSALRIDPSKFFNRAGSKSIGRGRKRERSRGESEVNA
ncbi:hypothetical protein MKW94_014638, partial [Papaver nudicaule]|nr:hypothetical protein [Papaver nudicaule]